MARKHTPTRRPGPQPAAGKVGEPKAARGTPAAPTPPVMRSGPPSPVVDIRMVQCGDCLDQLQRLPDRRVDLFCIDSPFNPGCPTRHEATPRGSRPRRVSGANSSRDLLWGERSEARAQPSGSPARFEPCHATTAAWIDCMRPRSVALPRVRRWAASFCCRRDGCASNPQPARSHGTSREQLP